MTDPFDLLAGLDESRPLPVSLRDRLETALRGAEAARPLDAVLAARLTTQMTDPVAQLLADLDAPRPLSPAFRAALAGQLRRRSARRGWAAAAGIALVASAAAVLVAVRTPDTSQTTAGSQPAASRTPAASAEPTAASGGSAAVGAAPAPVRVSAAPAPAMALPPAASGSGSTGGGVGAAPGSATGSGTSSLTSVTPDAGPLRGATTVRLRGPGLRTARTVTFGGAAGTGLRVNADGSLTVRTPAASAPRSVSVVVRLRDGSRVTRADGFTYVAPPHLDAAAPSSGPMGGGTWVTLEGTALARTTTVRFGETAATEIKVLSDTRVQARAPAHSAGPVDITLTTPGGTSNGVRYLYLP